MQIRKQQFTAKRSESDPSKVEVNWSDEAYFANLHTRDELMMVCAYPDHFTQPIATGVLRKKGEALIDLPADADTITGIWLFFRDSKCEAYSWDSVVWDIRFTVVNEDKTYSF